MTDLARFSLRSESDLLALVPHTLGFHPVESLVVVAIDARCRPLCGRVDLPEGLEHLPAVVDQLLVAAVRHQAVDIFVVAYSADEALAEVCATALVASLAEEEIRVICGIRATGDRWYPLAVLCRDPDDALVAEGQPYDVRTHPFTAATVVEGHVVLGSRQELADSLAADHALVEPVAAAYRALPSLSRRHTRLVREGTWLRRHVASLAAGRHRHLAEVGSDWSPDTAARVIRDLAHQDLRDLVWCDLSRRAADAHAEVWRSLLRRSPEERAAPVAAVLAFSAWLAGHGALAWCAVERAREVDADNVLAGLVAHALEQAVPPSTWVPFDPRTLRLHAG